MAEGSFYVEDVVVLRQHPKVVGMVDRTHRDVDSHEADLEAENPSGISKHRNVSAHEFNNFIDSGIAPKGTVLVNWQATTFEHGPDRPSELIPEADIALVDRGLVVGDVVKKSVLDPMNGTVIAASQRCSLQPFQQLSHARELSFLSGFPVHPCLWNLYTAAMHWQSRASLVSPDESTYLHDVPMVELETGYEYSEGDLIIHGDWLGRIDHVVDEITVRLGNNSVVVIENPNDLIALDHTIDRLSVGDIVFTKKGTLRRGRWKYGAYNPNVPTVGTVAEVRTINVGVVWVAQRDRDGDRNILGLRYNEPSTELNLDGLESGHYKPYPRTATPRNLPPKELNALLGTRLRFKDFVTACHKYNAMTILPNGEPQGKIRPASRILNLGYDLNYYTVVSTQTIVTVQWQDLSVTTQPSTTLVPNLEYNEEEEVWPGEVVCTKELQPPDTSLDEDEQRLLGDRPVKVGVVQSVKTQDQTAQARWYPDAQVMMIGDHNQFLFRDSSLGQLSESSEEVSTYEIRYRACLTKRRGDLVLIHYPTRDLDATRVAGSVASEDVDWLGEVIDCGLDGVLTVRLGAAKNVRDIRLSPDACTLAYSADDEDELYQDDYEGMDEDEEEEEEDFDTDAVFFVHSILGTGQPVNDADDAWMTEDGDESDTETERGDEHGGLDVNMANSPPTEIGQTLPTSMTSSESQAAEHANGHPLYDDMSLCLSSHPDAPPVYQVLDRPILPDDHHFLSTAPSGTPSTTDMRRVAKEHKILRTPGALPDGIFVHTWESRLDLIRVLVIGPLDTPYELAPFVIDLHMGPNFPSKPPDAFFHSCTDGSGPVNPNLYEDGKICLSLLGTWPTDERNESWRSTRSTVLQILVSILGLVLVREPYYNEAGYEPRYGLPEFAIPSALYTERTYIRTRAFLVQALDSSSHGFDHEMIWLYRGAPRLLERAIEAAKAIVARSEREVGGGGDEQNREARDGLKVISKGALVPLKRTIGKMEALRLEPLDAS
ncbi:hypothetical protein BJ546DRAFT_1074578 [Cryomyces antarcticus]